MREIKVQVEEGYEPLFEILVEALNQAQRGKGKQCHAENKPFMQQPIITEGREIGIWGHVFQVRKKVREAANCQDLDRAITDLLGAINYTAAMVIVRREKEEYVPYAKVLKVDGNNAGIEIGEKEDIYTEKAIQEEYFYRDSSNLLFKINEEAIGPTNEWPKE